jgi:hypothetical protein
MPGDAPSSRRPRGWGKRAKGRLPYLWGNRVMNLRVARITVVYLCLLGTPTIPAAEGRKAGPDQMGSRSAESSGPSRDLLALVHRTQQLAEQSQAELQRSREQNEGFRKSLAEMSQEVILLREEVYRLRALILSVRSNTSSSKGATEGPQAGNEDAAATSKSQTRDENTSDHLSKLADEVRINTARIKEQAQTKVESDSRYSVKLFGTILDNTYYNTSDRSDVAVPTAAPPPSSAVRNTGGNLGATLRQTQFGFAMSGPKLGGARLSADVNFDFFGSAGAYGSNALGALRMRTASARLEGPRTSLAVGLMTPMISPLNPTSLASLYYPALGESGNLWQWRPQLILERRTQIHEGDDLVLQAGLMMPFGDTVNGQQLAGRPGYESRIAFARRLGAERRLEVGLGGFVHPQPFGFGRTIDSYAATGDWLIPLSSRLELSGEAFYGQSIGLSEQSGGNIVDVFSFSGPLDSPGTVIRGVHSFGGWTQVSARLIPELEFNVAFGLDDPRSRDVFAGLFDNSRRLRNQTFSINSIYRFRSNFLIALEYRYIRTTYPDGRSANGHINIALGYLF